MKKYIALIALLTASLIAAGQCAGNQSATLNPPPPADGYQPGAVVEICYSMEGWEGTTQGSNWVEGFSIELGEGWVSFAPGNPPADCGDDNSGTWIWVESTSSDVTGLTAGPGWFFEGPQGPEDQNPGNDWGDFGTDCTWQFCFTVQAQDECTPGSLLIQVTPYADGSLGSWGTESCFDPPYVVYDGSTSETSDSFDVDVTVCESDLPYLWNDNLYDVGGDYDVTFTNVEGCDSVVTLHLNTYPPVVNGPITHNGIACPDSICVNTSREYTIGGAPNSIYRWWLEGGGDLQFSSTNNVDVTWGNTVGTWVLWCYEETTQGCLGDTIFCEITTLRPVIEAETLYRACVDQTVFLTAQPGGGTWSGTGLSGSTFTSKIPGLYGFTYTKNMYGCAVQKDVTVAVDPPEAAPLLLFDTHKIFACDQSLTEKYDLVPDTGHTYFWNVDGILQSEADGTITVTWPDTTLDHSILVYSINERGCLTESVEAAVYVETCNRFYAPNSFTPNGDGINDIFIVSGASIYNPVLTIYDRWGIVVYQSSSLLWTGDGGNGYYAQNDVYNWTIEYRDRLGTNRTEKGSVTLIR